MYHWQVDDVIDCFVLPTKGYRLRKSDFRLLALESAHWDSKVSKHHSNLGFPKKEAANMLDVVEQLMRPPYCIGARRGKKAVQRMLWDVVASSVGGRHMAVLIQLLFWGVDLAAKVR